MDGQDAQSHATRRDFPAINAEKETLIQFQKVYSSINKVANKNAKANICYICGQQMQTACNSHTIPRYCLKEISDNGKLLTTVALMGTNIRDSEVGIGEAAVFKQVCRKCDSEFFKLYETPGVLFERPSSRVLGQIAAKNLLRGISTSRHSIEFKNALGAAARELFEAEAAVKAIDLAEDERAFRIALRVGRNEKECSAYKIIFHVVLPYVAPIAFQQMINPVADFEGGLINNIFNQNSAYRIEPIHVCVLPSKGHTVVLMFRSEKAKRYRNFERQFSSLSQEQQLTAVIKLIFAYSEDVFLSKRIPKEALEDEALSKLSRMNCDYIETHSHPAVLGRQAIQTALLDYAIDSLPCPPNLLSSEYALV